MGRAHPRIQEVLETVQIDMRADDQVGTFLLWYAAASKDCLRIVAPILPFLFLDEPSATLDVDGVAMTRRVITKALEDGRIVIVANQ